jgi:RimJ/RimL family protein N-acetyltransferase
VYTRVVELTQGPAILVRPLRHGDVRTVLSLFKRLGERSRHARFHGPKPCLNASELRQLAFVDRTRHVLVDERPVAIARLVRDGRSAEVAFAVADAYQQRGIGSALGAELVADARAAGITELNALVASDNPGAVALLRRIAKRLDIRLEGTQLSIRAAV